MSFAPSDPRLQTALLHILVILTAFVSAHPPADRKLQPQVFDNPINYLTHFGYLPESNINSGNLMSDDQLKQAIKNLQHFASIPETGIIDEATKELMKRPRCGLSDNITTEHSNRRKRYTVHPGQHWKNTNLTWSLRSRWLGSMDMGRLRGDLHRALHIWAKHSKLSFREINSDKADILVYFERGTHGDGYPFDGRGQILAHAFFPGSGRGGDAHFDIDELWLLTGDPDHDEGTSLFAVAAHEFGHSLGLSHSSVHGALMYPWYQGFKPNFDLPEDDKLGIQQIYGAKTKEWGKNVHGKTRPPYNGQYPDNEVPVRPPYYYPRNPSPPPTPPPTTTTTTTRRTTTTTRRPRVTTRTPSNKPDACNTAFDAVSLIRGDTFMFKNEYVWRVGDNGPYPGYPALTKRLWADLPENFSRVDAVYERHDKKIVFFIGKYYWVYDGNRLEYEYPLPLTYLGLPANLERIDAAMIWGHNSKTYLFSGTQYWRMDEEIGRVELDYPRDMARVWKGVPYYIDAVMQWKDGVTYFFKGKGYWKFDDTRMRVEGEVEKPLSVFWMGCKPDEDDDNSIIPPTDRPIYRYNEGLNPTRDSGCSIAASLYLLTIAHFLHYLLRS